MSFSRAGKLHARHRAESKPIKRSFSSRQTKLNFDEKMLEFSETYVWDDQILEDKLAVGGEHEKQFRVTNDCRLGFKAVAILIAEKAGNAPKFPSSNLHHVIGLSPSARRISL